MYMHVNNKNFHHESLNHIEIASIHFWGVAD